MARQAGIRASVLYAVALQESGGSRDGRLVPWPWTLNFAGQLRRYLTRGAAYAGRQAALRSVAATRIDAGLGQINLGYQQHRYQDPCELLNPYRNLALAAAILREQDRQDDGWLVVIGRYHRPAGGAPAQRYRHSVAQHLQRVPGHCALLDAYIAPVYQMAVSQCILSPR